MSSNDTTKCGRRFVYIEGPPGAGKTTLINELAKRLPKAQVIREYIDDDPNGPEMLKKYLNKEISSFDFQSYILTHFERKPIYGSLVFVERTPLEGIEVFAALDYLERKAFSYSEFNRLLARARMMKQYPISAHPSIYLTEQLPIDELVDLVAKYIDTSSKQVIRVCLNPPVAVLRYNISCRNRPGEIESYTDDYLEWMNKRYKFLVRK